MDATSLVSLGLLPVGAVEKTVLFSQQDSLLVHKTGKLCMCVCVCARMWPFSCLQPSRKGRAIVSNGIQLFLVQSVLINASDFIVFLHSGSRRAAASEGLPCEFAEEGCTGIGGYVGHLCSFSQAAKPICSSLHYSVSHAPCYAGPLVECRDYLKKKKKELGNLSFSFMFSLFPSYLKANTEFTFLH